MGTKIIVLGEVEKKSTKKKIEFVSMLDSDLRITEYVTDPEEWENIELVTKAYGRYDIMFAYDDGDRNGSGTLYIGHFNDGVV